MHNAWLIARREYLERVRTRAFIVSTILIPLAHGGFVFGSYIMDARHKPAIMHLVVASSDTDLGPRSSKAVGERQKSSFSGRPDLPPNSGTRDILNQELDDKSVDGYLWITPRSASNAPPSAVYTTRMSHAPGSPTALSIEDALLAVHIQSFRTEQAPNAPKSSTAIAYVLFFLMYMASCSTA